MTNKQNDKMIANLKGFTAAEIITVVAIIAILALIAIPRFWSRTEEARIARANEEMARMADAESLAYADTGFYVTLGNLHGTEPIPTGTAITTWNYQNWLSYAASGTNGQYPNLPVGYVVNTVKTWQGPYITFQISEMQDETSFAPLDPWKNPYVFYGPITVSAGDTSFSSKIRFWSRGPNLIFDSATTFPWGPPYGDDIFYTR